MSGIETVRAPTGERALLVLAATVVVCAGIKLAAPVLVPVLLASLATAAIYPVVVRLQQVGLPRSIATAVTIGIAMITLATFGLLLALAASRVGAELPSLRAELGEALGRVEAWLRSHDLSLRRETLAEVIDPGSAMGLMGYLLQSLTQLLSNLLLVVLIVGFLLLEAAGFHLKLARVVTSEEGLAGARQVVGEVYTYLGVKTSTSLLTGLVVAGFTYAWGRDLWLVWGVLAFLLNYIPTIGSFVAAVPAVAITALDSGAGSALGLAGAYLAVNVAVGTQLEPRLLGRALGLSPLVVFLAVLGWGFLLGPVGALLSAPLTLIVKVSVANTEDLRWIAVLLGTGREPAPAPPALTPSEAEAEPGDARPEHEAEREAP